jgi:deoxyribonuclease-4
MRQRLFWRAGRDVLGCRMMRFGVAGYPPAFLCSEFRKDRLKICEWLRLIGLDALELQMTYGPRSSEATCRAYRRESEAWDIKLSVHASYFIVLTSAETTKLRNSSDTLKRTFELAALLGADAVVLHPGSLYRSKDPAEILNRFVDNLGAAMAAIGPTESNLFVETAGKTGQLGSVEEILSICEQVPWVFPCIDFGHVHARSGGSLDSEEAVSDLFQLLATRGYLGGDRRIHFHFTPIAYGPAGEIRHQKVNDRVTPDGPLFHPRPEAIARGLRKWGGSCTVISETSDSQDEGALALKAAYECFPESKRGVCHETPASPQE